MRTCTDTIWLSHCSQVPDDSSPELQCWAQGDRTNIPPTINTNFSYGFLPAEASSAFAPPVGSSRGVAGNIEGFVGNVRDSFGAVGSTISEFLSSPA